MLMIFHAKNINGEIYYIDSQINAILNVDDILRNFDDAFNNFWILRVDNRNVTNAIIDAVMNME